MKRLSIHRLAGLSLLLLLLTACNLPFGSATDQEVSEAMLTMVAQTVIAELTQNAPKATVAVEVEQVQPTQEPSPQEPEQPTLTFTATTEPTVEPTVEPPQEPQEDPTPTDTLTPEDEKPQITANVSTNCRYGPDIVFDILGYLVEGETSEVHGKDQGGYWWYIANPDRPGEFCWVWAETTVVTGDVSAIPYKEPPPTPTPTPTPTDTPTPTPTETEEPV